MSRRSSSLVKASFAFALWVSLGGIAHAQVQASQIGTTANQSTGKRAGSFTLGDQSYRVVSAADYTTSTDVGQAAANTIAQAGWFLGDDAGGSYCDAACSSCGGFGNSMNCGGTCGGTCGSCNSCGGCGSYGDMGGAYGMSTACPKCEPYWYGSVEAIDMRRTGSRRFTASPDFFLTDFDLEWAPRVTIGAVPDCVRGYEVSYTGRLTWDRVGFQSSPTGGLGTYLFAVAPVTSAALSAFNNATAQAQFYNSEFWSIDASSTMVGWDVAKLQIGVRYIDYDENFSIFSQTATESGFLNSDIKNQMIGAQVGMDLLYPICHRTYTDFRLRAGVYANFIDLNLQVINAGSTTALVLDNATKLAGQVEVGSGVRYELNDMIAVRSGIEIWYLNGIASAKDQFRDGIVAHRNVRAKDDFIAVGLNVGAVLRY